MLVMWYMKLADHSKLCSCLLTAGLLLVKLLPPAMTEPASEHEAPLVTGDHCGSPLASHVSLHTDEEALVGPSTHVTHMSSALRQQWHAYDRCNIGPSKYTFNHCCFWIRIDGVAGVCPITICRTICRHSRQDCVRHCDVCMCVYSLQPQSNLCCRVHCWVPNNHF